MAYYIYENWQSGPHKAVIHHDSCGNCQEGHGKAGGYDRTYARWIGPYPTPEDARNAAQMLTGVQVHKECVCMKWRKA